MTRGREIEAKIRKYFENARKNMLEITDDMLCDEGDGEKVYYMNGNDGTYFDWCCNERLCEFFMFFKSTEMGFIKVFVNNDDTITGYMYKENYNYGDNQICLEKVKISNGDALYLAALMDKMADKKHLYDKPISQIDFDYEPSAWEIADMCEDEDDEEDWC